MKLHEALEQDHSLNSAAEVLTTVLDHAGIVTDIVSSEGFAEAEYSGTVYKVEMPDTDYWTLEVIDASPFTFYLDDFIEQRDLENFEQYLHRRPTAVPG